MAESLLVGRNFVSGICKFKKKLFLKLRFLPALVLSINMMMHIFHYLITGLGKHINMSENGGDEFSL